MTGSHAYDPEQDVDEEADRLLGELRDGETSSSVADLEAKLSRWNLYALRHRGLALTAPSDKGAVDLAVVGHNLRWVAHLLTLVRPRPFPLPHEVQCQRSPVSGGPVCGRVFTRATRQQIVEFGHHGMAICDGLIRVNGRLGRCDGELHLKEIAP